MIKVKLKCGKELIVDKIEDLQNRKINLNSAGYARYTEVVHYHPYRKYKTTLLHRVIAEAKEGEIVDHINGNRLDNRRCNLRITNQRLNILARHKVNNTSSYKNVHVFSKTPNHYYVTITYENFKIRLGKFTDLEMAARYADFGMLTITKGFKTELNFESSKDYDYTTLTLNRLQYLIEQKNLNEIHRESKRRELAKILDYLKIQS